MKRKTQGAPGFDVPLLLGLLRPGDKEVPKRFRQRIVTSFFVTHQAHGGLMLVHGDQRADLRWRHNRKKRRPPLLVLHRDRDGGLSHPEMRWVARMLNAARAGVLDLSMAKMYEEAKRSKQVIAVAVAPDGLHVRTPMSEELVRDMGPGQVDAYWLSGYAAAADEARARK